MVLEILHRALVRLGSFARVERAQIPPLAGLRILLTRIQAILSRLQFCHSNLLKRGKFGATAENQQ
jgi:hypothetical protein